MKYRYLFEKFGEVHGTNELTKQHLIDVKNRMSDLLIDTENGTYYDADNNEWVAIKNA